MALGSRAVALLNEQYRKVLQKMRGLEWLAEQVGPMLAGIRAQVSPLNPAGAGQRSGGGGLALCPIHAELLETRCLLAATCPDLTAVQAAAQVATIALTSDPHSLEVNDVPPTMNLSGSTTGYQGKTYNLGLKASGPGANTIQHWNIDWGDGTAGEVGVDGVATNH